MEPYNQIHGDRAADHDPFFKTHDAYEYIKKKLIKGIVKYSFLNIFDHKFSSPALLIMIHLIICKQIF